MVKDTGPLSQYLVIGIVLYIENRADMVCLKQIQTTQSAKGLLEPLSFFGPNQPPWLLANEGDDLLRLRILEQHFRMRGNNQLAIAALGYTAEQVEDLPLQNEVKMRVRFVQQQYGRRARMKKGQK